MKSPDEGDKVLANPALPLGFYAVIRELRVVEVGEEAPKRKLLALAAGAKVPLQPKKPVVKVEMAPLAEKKAPVVEAPPPEVETDAAGYLVVPEGPKLSERFSVKDAPDYKGGPT